MAAQNRVLILGVGNTLLGDEGFGVHALCYLEEHYLWPDNVRLVDGGTLGLLLMAELLECDLAVILDIALGGAPAGSFYRLEDDALSSSLSLRQSMHQTSIADVLVSCDLAGHRPKTVIFALEPFELGGMKAQLSEAAAEKLPGFCEKVVENLREMGIAPKERDA